MKTTEARPVGIWIRVSTEDQVKGESPEHHEARARAYAEFKGWHVIERYRIDAVSGKTIKDHPEAKRMVADVKSGRIKALVFSKLARLARNTRELLDFADLFKENNADLISLAESIDTSTPTGVLFYTMIAALAQWERAEIADRVAASVPIRAKLGKSLGGAAPFGYQWVDKQMLVDRKEAPVRKLMYELYLEFRRVKTVARALNERGYRTRQGAPWSDTTVSRLLADPTAKGLRLANHTKSIKNGGAWVSKPKEDWVYVPVEAIVDEELWETCTAILLGQRAKGVRQPKRVTHLFSGVTFCHCGNKMYVPQESKKYTCYSCRNKIPIIDLEAIFADQLKQFVFSQADIREYAERGSVRLQDQEKLLEALAAEQAKLTKESDRLYDLYQAGAIDPAGFRNRHEKIGLRLQQLNDELPQIEGRRDALKIALLSQEDVLEGARDLYGRWAELSHEDRRRIVETIVKSITVGDGEVEINLLYSPGIAPSNSTPPTGGSSNGGARKGGHPSLPPQVRDSQRATHAHSRVALLPEVGLTLKALKPIKVFPEPQTLGQHLAARRRVLGISQPQAAKVLGISREAVLHWEKDRRAFPDKYWPKVLSYLGYDPYAPAETATLAEKLKAWRRVRGLSVKQAARTVRINADTWSLWEKGQVPKYQGHKELVGRILTDPAPANTI